MKNDSRDITLAEPDSQDTPELPERDLLIGVSVLGISLAGVDGVSGNVDTSGPNRLFGSLGSV